jgi:hypothetical protein
MKIYSIEEPELDFGSGTHIDIRYGISNFGPLDLDTANAPRQLNLGVIGTPESCESTIAWLERCASGIEAKSSSHPRLFTRFPPLSASSGFCSELVMDSSMTRHISKRQIEDIAQLPSNKERVDMSVDLFMKNAEFLVQNFRPSVLVCAPSIELLDALKAEGFQRVRYDFRHLLKARSMRLRIPIQIILPATYDPSKARKQARTGVLRPLQDEATRAWNFFSALYYKSGGTPWRVPRNSRDLASCFVGVSFFESLDETALLTSSAQVFNERGEGVVVRGGTATISKDDRQAHLKFEGAYGLLQTALQRYREVHMTLPARVVIHKSSSYSEEEQLGFRQALKEANVEIFDFISIGDSDSRLFRDGRYPPLRGTMAAFDEREMLLYTRGSVPFFETYPGLYIPRPLRILANTSDSTALAICSEIMSLTKLNWNTTQFDGRLPVTLRAALEVSKVLRFCEPNQVIEPRYSHYM